MLFYRKYVHSIFCLFQSEHDDEPFFNFINRHHHPNIRFTLEKEIDKKLQTLDVLLKCSETNAFKISANYKKTYTGLITNYNSFTPSGYKFGLIKTLIDHAS